MRDWVRVLVLVWEKAAGEKSVILKKKKNKRQKQKLRDQSHGQRRKLSGLWFHRLLERFANCFPRCWYCFSRFCTLFPFVSREYLWERLTRKINLICLFVHWPYFHFSLEFQRVSFYFFIYFSCGICLT